jgi:hypothetical protein
MMRAQHPKKARATIQIIEGKSNSLEKIGKMA